MLVVFICRIRDTFQKQRKFNPRKIEPRPYVLYKKMWNFLVYMKNLSDAAHPVKRPRKSSKLDHEYQTPRELVRVWYRLE